MPERTADADLLKLYSFGLFTQLSGAVTAGMIHLGDKLGLFAALAGAGEPVTAAELAETTGLDERWVREWAYNQAAARIISVDGDDDRDDEAAGAERFWLSPEAVAVLASPDHEAYGMGMFHRFPQTMAALEADAGELPHRRSGTTTTATDPKAPSASNAASNRGTVTICCPTCCRPSTGSWTD